MDFQLLGVGSPLVDYSLAVSEKFLQNCVPGGKGCTRNISDKEKADILHSSGQASLKTPGGSAANSIRTFADLGGKASFFGKTGIDEDCLFFEYALKESNVDSSLLIKDKNFSTGYCLSLITPDAERTMLSNLGASVQITADEIKTLDLSNFDYLLLEGYLANEPWIDILLDQARQKRCRIALDLNNYELAARQRSRFNKIISDGIDLLFANIQEAESFLDLQDNHRQIIEKFSSLVPVTVLKYGSKGAKIISGRETIDIPACQNINVIDTTGAGDFFAAGFFYGISRQCSWEVCGKLGSLCAGAVISETGTKLPEEKLQQLKNNIYNEVKK